MTSKNSIPLRVDKEFQGMLREVRTERIKNGKDKNPLSLTRLTTALKNIPNIKDVLVKANIRSKF
jgi:hypothetical protein